ncbi:hypothetical protein [Roseibium salinum]|uniref:Beta/gamma crystallin n=1 Tax=Roseibium salinum TaxID=1604349 RepID=A0ABT3R0C4_9HYPH|nr:hypothetical protein [Roseibium sp. DSM 29163]MCX2722661.1 hypothetical protein [Roseibium sp. DSM 29163]
MKKFIATLGAFACFCGTAFAGPISQSGDFVLMSRDRFGLFVGSHKLFLQDSDGLKKVSYCNRDYYIRSKTVAWTQLESERGHVVRIELNYGRGWRPICDNPERQVTLQDIGVSMSAQEVLQSADESSKRQGRLSAVSRIFGTGGPEDEPSTYHTR